jgi:hypothetical protein
MRSIEAAAMQFRESGKICLHIIPYAAVAAFNFVFDYFFQNLFGNTVIEPPVLLDVFVLELKLPVIVIISIIRCVGITVSSTGQKKNQQTQNTVKTE